MSIRDRFRDWLLEGPRYAAPAAAGFQNAGDIPQTPLPQITRNSSTWGDFFGSIPGLPVVTEQTAMTIAAAFACVNLISGAISALPTNIYSRRDDGERDQVHGEDLWRILNEQFLPRWNAANGWEYLGQSLLFHGDSFALIHRRRGLRVGEVEGIEPVHPLAVTPLATPDRKRLVYAVRREQGQVEVYDQDDVLHVAGFGFDGFRGLSPLKHHLRMSGSVALATQEFAARFFANNARPDIVISSDQDLNEEQATLLRDAWERLYSGLHNSHRPAVLGNGATVTPLTIPAEDAQLLAMRQFQIEEIARIYGVPPFMIGHTEKTTSWGSGVEAMGIGFVRFTLRQHLTKIEKELNRKLFQTAGKFIEFDTFDLEKADMKTLFAGFRAALGRAGEPGFMTAEEVRNRLNLKRKPDHGELHRGEGKPAPRDPNNPDDDDDDDRDDRKAA